MSVFLLLTFYVFFKSSDFSFVFFFLFHFNRFFFSSDFFCLLFSLCSFFLPSICLIVYFIALYFLYFFVFFWFTFFFFHYLSLDMHLFFCFFCFLLFCFYLDSFFSVCPSLTCFSLVRPLDLHNFYKIIYLFSLAWNKFSFMASPVTTELSTPLDLCSRWTREHNTAVGV